MTGLPQVLEDGQVVCWRSKDRASVPLSELIKQAEAQFPGMPLDKLGVAGTGPGGRASDSLYLRQTA